MDYSQNMQALCQISTANLGFVNTESRKSEIEAMKGVQLHTASVSSAT